LNENFKTKLEELEAARDAVDKTEIEAKLDELRREKDGLETVLSETSQQRDKAEFELSKLKDATMTIKQELEFAIEDKMGKMSKLETKISKMSEEKSKMMVELQDLQNTVTELEVKCQHHLTDKRELRASLSETQKSVSDFESKMGELECQLSTERTRRVSDAEEWKQFQADLLMTVRVANDFQTEAQSNLEQKSSETEELREKIKLLENETERLKKSAANSRAAATITRTPPHANPNHGQVSEGLTSLRNKYTRSQTVDSKATVKGLIDSIESAAKARTACYTRSSSTPTMVPTLSPIAENPSKPVFTSCSASQLPALPAKEPSSPFSGEKAEPVEAGQVPASPVSILSNKTAARQPRVFDSFSSTSGADPLAALVKNGGSKRNALLKWCQSKTAGYVDVDITNFSSSWNDGMAFCALLHTYMPEKIPYGSLKASEKRRNFTIAFESAEAVGVHTSLNLTEMVSIERPDWQQIMTYVTNIYKHFET